MALFEIKKECSITKTNKIDEWVARRPTRRVPA